jgi:hypothetical protein
MIDTILIICLIWSAIGVSLDIKFGLTNLPHWLWAFIMGPCIWIVVLGVMIHDAIVYKK